MRLVAYTLGSLCALSHVASEHVYTEDMPKIELHSSHEHKRDVYGVDDEDIIVEKAPAIAAHVPQKTRSVLRAIKAHRHHDRHHSKKGTRSAHRVKKLRSNQAKKKLAHRVKKAHVHTGNLGETTSLVQARKKSNTKGSTQKRKKSRSASFDDEDDE